MSLQPGDWISCEKDGEAFSMQVVSSPDGGKSWFCVRDDLPKNQTAIILSEDELQTLLSKTHTTNSESSSYHS